MKQKKIEGAVLNQELEALARQCRADLFGVADLAPALEFVAAQGGSLVEKFPRAISFGMRLSGTVLERQDPDEPPKQSFYAYHQRVVNAALDALAYAAVRCLEDQGYEALPVPATGYFNEEKLASSIISHRLVAHLAGLGWIGKSCLLVTNLFGPRVRFSSVLTDAPLETGSVLDKRCGKCRICIDICPVNAFTGVEFEASESRDIRFDAAKCWPYHRQHHCGRCLLSCPVGNRERRL